MRRAFNELRFAISYVHNDIKPVRTVPKQSRGTASFQTDRVFVTPTRPAGSTSCEKTIPAEICCAGWQINDHMPVAGLPTEAFHPFILGS
jgi:hypothetical protein